MKPSLILVYVFAICCIAFDSFAQTPTTWVTKSNAQSRGQNEAHYFQPDYPIVFISAPIVEVLDGSGIKGTWTSCMDVLDNNCAHTSGSDTWRGHDHRIWILLPDGQVKLIFPIVGRDEANVDAALTDGTAQSASISEDGKRLYFSWVHNSRTGDGTGEREGADLYATNLEPLLEDYNFDPSALSITRLTSTTNPHADATNPSLSISTGTNSSGQADFGVFHLDPVEMRTRHGLNLVWSSDAKRLHNSNEIRTGDEANRNFMLFIADITGEGLLANQRVFQYYTTTSAIGPARSKNGITFAYQDTIQDGRLWDIHETDSEGRWRPIAGYASGPELYHLATYCLKQLGPDPGDYTVAARYYNRNNNGFGKAVALPMESAGLNVVTQSSNIGWEEQGSYNITTGAVSGDVPSAKAAGKYIGKVSGPRCGKPDELYLVYTPTSANGRLNDDEGNFNVYRPYIIRSGPTDGGNSGLDPFHPVFDLGQRYHIIVNDPTESYASLNPVPVIPWSERVAGSAEQESSPILVDPDTTIMAGLPWSTVGTSALYNTDVTPIDCRLGGEYWNPEFSYAQNTRDSVINDIDNLSVLVDPDCAEGVSTCDFCQQPLPQDVLGIAIYTTSFEPNLSKRSDGGYSTLESGPLESKQLLGVYDSRGYEESNLSDGSSDLSFKAIVPARIPIDFHLIERRYGLRIADVQGWHSLMPRETRTDCGGCHNHKEGEGKPFSGSIADKSSASNFVEETPFIEYDAFCNPVLSVSETPTREIPIWQDLYPQFDSFCGECHKNNRNNKFNYRSEEDAYDKLEDGLFILEDGALASPAWWAARGQRTDGRPNQNYAGSNYFHSPHEGLCDGTNLEAAKWLYQFGLWIDNHMPTNDKDSGPDYRFDRFPPSADAVLIDSTCSATTLRVGYWDNSGTVSVFLRHNSSEFYSALDVSNGHVEIALPSGVSGDDQLEVEVIDASDNRQKYSRYISHLIKDCLDDSSNKNGLSEEDESLDPGLPVLASISSDKSNVRPGSKLTLAIESAPLNSSFQILYSVTGSSGFTTLGGNQIPLNFDGVTQSSLDIQAYQGEINADGARELVVRVPYSNIPSQNFGQEFLIRAYFENSDGSAGISNLLNVTLNTIKDRKLRKRKNKRKNTKAKRRENLRFHGQRCSDRGLGRSERKRACKRKRAVRKKIRKERRALRRGGVFKALA